MKRLLIEAFGWYGAAAVVLAYGLTSFQLLDPSSWWFLFLNGTGSLGILTVSLYKKTYQPAALNLVWLLIACAAAAQML
jgi:hypothetical protein